MTGKKMDAELKARWVRALRSKKYKQGTGELRTHNGAYCCLGVLCAIEGADWTSSRIGDIRFKRVDECYLTSEMLALVGMTDKQQKTLGQMNDAGTRFRKIADYIEANL